MRRGYSLIEMIVSMMIFSTLAVVGGMVFFSNVVMFDKRMSSADLWQEANVFIEAVTEDVREASRVDVPSGSDDVLIGYDRDGNQAFRYEIADDGKVRALSGPWGGTVFTRRADSSKSGFEHYGNMIDVSITLIDPSFVKDIAVATGTRIVLRN
ncbi:MAG: type II secretion system protein J [Candidatus Omnitrophota bacterium]